MKHKFIVGLLEWFNPNPSRYFNGLDDKACYDLLSLSKDESALPLQDQDFSENLFFYATGK